jgi:hypothetical protein
VILEEGPRSSGSGGEVRSWRQPRVLSGRSPGAVSPWRVVEGTPHSSEGHRPDFSGRLELSGFFRFFGGEGVFRGRSEREVNWIFRVDVFRNFRNEGFFEVGSGGVVVWRGFEDMKEV